MQVLLLQVDASDIAGHEACEPDAALNLLYAKSLSGHDGRGVECGDGSGHRKGGAQISDLSPKLLITQHSGVHEQFDYVYAAALAFKAIHEELETLDRTLRSNQKRLIKSLVRNKMDEIGLRRSWLGINQGVTMYAFEFIELLVHNERLALSATIDEYFDELLSDLAVELDAEFSATGLADSIGYLKRRLGRIGVFQ